MHAPRDPSVRRMIGIVIGIVLGIVIGIVLGIVLGIVIGIVLGTMLGIMLGIVLGIMLGIMIGVESNRVQPTCAINTSRTRVPDSRTNHGNSHTQWHECVEHR